MKTTKYFQMRRLLPDRIEIQDSWIERTLENPDKTFRQFDGRIRVWKKIEEAGGRYLRVILLEDEMTVHNAFFDRSYTGANK